MDREALRGIIGRSADTLSLRERIAVAGKWIALELYTPRTIPLRVIEAIGDSPAECIRILRERGLDPAQFEFSPLKPPLDRQ
jgi:hypothetical protein